MDDFLQQLPRLFKQQYPDLLVMTQYRQPNYLEIRLEPFLCRFFGLPMQLVHEDAVKAIRATLTKRFPEQVAEQFFSAAGTLQIVPFTALSYYQPEVGIEGPKYTGMDTPVYVVSQNERLLLFNGYHRALCKIMSGDKAISAYVLELSA